ncbi:MAG: cysteine--tRNA ligase [Acidimicrobiales bacterium]|nr:cysteine--tRNA ligase [Acidimicrobiales bacterium]
MPLHIYDTMQRQKVPFTPRAEGEVAMYVCGPTVYDLPHLGHGRTALTYDMIRRYLTWTGLRVLVASNVTDIDDKIIVRAEQEGRTEPDVAAEFTAKYDEQMERLSILPPDSRPHATQFIDGMIDIISQLIDRGAAYVVEDKGVYFSVGNLSEYGRLAGRTLDQLLDDAGQRVDVDTDKKSPLDFALWKSAKPGEPSWFTPWGVGRPGWHTECVAMSLSALGTGFDIHGGGDDLCFPHHQNEWAQVTAMGQQFARYWVHSAMVNVAGEKMSKSLGNFTNLAEAIDTAGPRAFRLLALQTHYRRAMEMGRDALMAADAAVNRLDAFHRRMVTANVDLNGGELHEASIAAFRLAMDDDFSTPTALDNAFSLIRSANSDLDNSDLVAAGLKSRTAVEMFSVLGIEIGSQEAKTNVGPTDQEIEDLLEQRAQARGDKDFATADRIRDELASADVVIEDSANGVVWHRA